MISFDWLTMRCWFYFQVSTHGYSQNQILIWKYPSLVQIAKLTGHTFRVLYLVSHHSSDQKFILQRTQYWAAVKQRILAYYYYYYYYYYSIKSSNQLVVQISLSSNIPRYSSLNWQYAMKPTWSIQRTIKSTNTTLFTIFYNLLIEILM